MPELQKLFMRYALAPGVLICVGCRPETVPSDKTILTKESDRDPLDATPDEGLFLEPRQMDLGNIGTFHIEVPIDLMLSDGRRKQGVFGMSGLVAP